MAFVQAVHMTGEPDSGDTSTVTITGVTAGSTLLVFSKQASDSRYITAVSDDNGSGWAAARSAVGNSFGLSSWYLENANAGTHVLTLTFDSASASAIYGCAVEDGAAASSYDSAASGSATTGGSTAANLTITGDGATNQADTTVYSWCCSGSPSRPLSVPSGYTQRYTANSDQVMLASLLLSATGTQAPQWTVSGGNSTLAGVLLPIKNATAGTVIPVFMNQYRQRGN